VKTKPSIPFLEVFRVSPDPLFLLDPGGMILEYNPATARVSGLTPEEILGRSFLDLIQPGERDAVQAGFLSHRGRAMTFSFEAGFLVAPGRYRSFHWILIRPEGEDGVFVVTRDTGILREAQRELAESREKFKILADGATEGIVLSERGVILEVNAAMSRMSGFAVGEIVGQPVLRFSPPEDHENILRKIREDVTDPYEIRGIRKDGSVFPMEIFGRSMDYQGRKVRVTILRDITDRKRLLDLARLETEKALKSQENLFEALTENALEMITVLDPDGQIRYSGAANKRILGYNPLENLGRSLFDLLHPEDRERVRNAFLELSKKPGAVQVTEFRAQHRDGTWQDMEVTAKNLFNEPPVRGMVCNIRDISARKRAENDLRLSERFHRSLAENALDVVLLHDEQGAFRYVSPSAEWVLGYVPDTVIGKSLFDFIHPDDLAATMDLLKFVLKGGEQKAVQSLRCRHANGTWRQVEILSQNLLEDPVVRGFVVNLRDVTDRVRVEGALRESEANLRGLFDTVDQVVMLLDRAGGIRAFNRNAQNGAQTLLGRSLELGAVFFEYLPGSFSGVLREKFRRVLQGEFLAAEVAYPAPDGPPHWYDYRVYPVRDDSGLVSGVCLTALCIDARKQAEERALHVERLAAIGQVTGAIAHEMRNPLSVISALAKEKADAGDPDGQRLSTQALKLQSLMDDILDFSRRTELKRSPLVLEAALQTAFESAKTQAGETGVRVAARWDLRPPLDGLQGDREKLEQVFHNLILNAFQALGGKGTLCLGGRRTGSGWVVTVQDDGPGLPVKDLNRIFEPFYTTKDLGTGLGLAICRKIVEDHGGRITAQRLEPHGMLFEVVLPFASPA